jgi:trehalose 6-phosphate synthase
MAPSVQKRKVMQLLTVSNRGPVNFEHDEDGNVIAVPGQGGLATALRVAAQLYPTKWLSSPLTALDRAVAEGELSPEEGASCHFVITDPDAYDLFYGIFSNEILWFLQHRLEWPQEFSIDRMGEAFHNGYVPVNQAFADATVEELDSGNVRAVMFHDYHFYLAPRMVREQRPDAYLQHFVHIPWPGPQEWSRLEGATVRAICEGMLGNDSLVFQTPSDVCNFLDTVELSLGMEVDKENGVVTYDGRETRVWSNGISVDPAELDEVSQTADFARYRYLMRAAPGQKTIMRVDRLDPTKNVVRGFAAYERLLEDHPELRNHVVFLALLVPTKGDIPAYQRYQDEAHELVARINRRFGNLQWKPVRLLFEHNRVQALAAMSLYDVMLVNPVADGMNLVAKEGPVLNNRSGVLVLSKTAGAYADLSHGALGVDPEDVEGTAEALYQALTMPIEERRERAVSLNRGVRQHDLKAWFRDLLTDIEDHAPVDSSSSAA